MTRHSTGTSWCHTLTFESSGEAQHISEQSAFIDGFTLPKLHSFFWPLVQACGGGFCMIPISHVRKLRLLKINDNQKPTVNQKAGTQIQGFWHQIWYIFYKNSISFESKPVLPFLSGQIQCLTDGWVFWLGKSFPYPSILKQLSFWRHYIFIS